MLRQIGKLYQTATTVATSENDIVLDFFMGSATTQAVAMKMNRKFIGIEQMDYIKTVSVPRLQKVLKGEQGGISKDVDWAGGGNFVYAELYELNMKFVDLIQKAGNENELTLICEQLNQCAYLNFKADKEKVTIEDEGFANLSFNDKKQLLIELLDSNQLYLSYSEIDDAKYEISNIEKEFNWSFYEAEDEEK